MDAFKIAAIGIVGAILTLSVKQYKAEMAVMIGIVTGLVLLGMTVDGIKKIFLLINEIMNKSGVKNEYLTAVMKTVGIAYVTQFASEICKDGGQNSIALKVETAGKILVLLYTLPIIGDFLDVCIRAVSLI